MKNNEQINDAAKRAVMYTEEALKDGNRKLTYDLYVERGFEKLFEDLKSNNGINEEVLSEWFKVAGGYYGSMEIYTTETDYFIAGPILVGTDTVHNLLTDKKKFREIIGSVMGRNTHVPGSGNGIMREFVNDIDKTLNASQDNVEEETDESSPSEETPATSYIAY